MKSKKLHVMQGQVWFDSHGEFLVLAVADGFAMCRRGAGMPFVRSVNQVKDTAGLRGADLSDEQKLSAVEFSIMQEIAGGKRVIEIARERQVSASTVSTYRTRILKKLGMRSNIELALFAMSKRPSGNAAARP